MIKEFWNTRYKEEAYAYGKTPNNYLKEVLSELNPNGKLLLPAEGEGRNAVYAAKAGFDVVAFDLSVEGRNKALKLAETENISINYQVGTIDELDFEENSFDVISLIYAHFKPELRVGIHQKLIGLLKPNGILILEGFSKKHIEYQKVNPTVGGPKNEIMLFSEDEIALDFKGLETKTLIEKEIYLEEGTYHKGLASVIRYVGKKVI